MAGDRRATVGLLFVGCLGVSLMLGLWWSQRYTSPVTLDAVACDINLGDCRVETDQGQVTLAITPRPVQPLKPLRAVVTTKGFTTEAVALAFTGINVDMGDMRYPLQKTGDGRYEGPVSLSVCAQTRMHWQAMVSIDEKLRLPFSFESEYKPVYTLLE